MVELVDTQDLKSCSRKRSAGSIPALSTNPDTGVSGFCVKMSTYTNAKVAQLVEHDLAKVGVASSNLVFRSECLKQQSLIFSYQALLFKAACYLFSVVSYKTVPL
jgi:hypothetical protein